MASPVRVRHHSILSFVKRGSTISNTVLLLVHSFFSVFFHSSAEILFYYNLLSIAVYLVGYFILYKNMSTAYSTLVNLEVYAFMILGVLCLGWEYGFQQYSFIFVVSFLFTDYSVSQTHKLQKTTIVMISISIFTYLFLRLWAYDHAPIYVLSSDIPARTFFIVNNIIAFSFLITYSYLYSQTVFKLESALTEAATKDALTGLYNRRKMQDLLNAMSELLATTGNHMCLAMIDIDDFKKINDTYGHDAGDEVLKALANVLLNRCDDAKGFYSCRWGGEEFLVFYRMDQQSNDDIYQEFDALRKQVEQTVVHHNDMDIHFTITTGLAFYQKGLSINELVKLADNNLYEGKGTGKNIVIYKK